MTPQEALRVIEGLEKFGMKLGLERIAACLAALGQPQDAYPTIHVGGTNGKGSTCLLASRVLQESGRRVGLYTSPPLEFFGERIQVDGQLLPDSEIPGLLDPVLRTWDEEPLAAGMTQFEVITAMAFLYFARREVEAAVVEVGLGGRLDSTNVVRPVACAVTNVGLEHAEHLGPTVADIAREKAGIAKPGVPLVTAAEGEALVAVEAEARRRGAPVYALGRDFSCVRASGGTWTYRGRRWILGDLRFGLVGGYQALNLAVALAALEAASEAGWSVPEAAVRRAVSEARWPGRLEVLRRSEDEPTIVLDGAHNPHASRVLAESLEHDLPHERLTLVLAILGDKDARSILADLLPLADRVIFTRSASRRALDPSELESLGRRVGVAASRAVPGLREALAEALSGAASGDLICVTGSLTTVGEARTALRTMGWVR